MIVHSFIPKMASDYGIEKAVLMYYFLLWIEKNASDGACFYEGRYWVYGSQKSLAGMFPYMSEDKVQRNISSLVKDGLLLKGNFNDSPTDRTAWYAFSDKMIDYIDSIPQKCGLHSVELRIPFRKTAESGTEEKRPLAIPSAIPQNYGMHSADLRNDIDIDNISSKDINISTTEKEINKEKVRKPKFVADLSFIKNPEHLELFKEWIEYRHQLGCPYKTQKGTEGGYKKLVTLSGGNVSKMREIMDQSISEEWQGLFAIKNQNNGRNNQQSGGAILIPLEEVKGGSSTI